MANAGTRAFGGNDGAYTFSTSTPSYGQPDGFIGARKPFTDDDKAGPSDGPSDGPSADALRKKELTLVKVTRHKRRTSGWLAVDIKIVYRILRLISDTLAWAFYKEVYVSRARLQEGSGEDNSAALILASSHHNEIIDIAILTITAPLRCFVHYWTKAGLFRGPTSRWILFSAGSIPVHRPTSSPPHAKSTSASSVAARAIAGAPESSNSDASNSKPKPRPKAGAHLESLYNATYEILSSPGALGVFPEGTSYTEPRIAQVKDGVGWAAVGYLRWLKEHRHDEASPKDVHIVPVGIVYTDKSQYRSRIFVHYGAPVSARFYASQLLSSTEYDEDEARKVVKRITGAVERELVSLTVSAPDWEILHAANTLRAILWPDEARIPLQHWVKVNQTLVTLLASQTESMSRLRATLLKYYSLQHYTGLNHAALTPLPLTSGTQPSKHINPRTTLRKTLLQTFLTSLITLPCFLVPLAYHLPSYVVGYFAQRIAGRDEEARAQFKVVLGGFTLCVTYPWLSWRVVRYFATANFTPLMLGQKLGASGWAGTVARAITAAGVAVGVGCWHETMIDGQYARLKRILSSLRLYRGLHAKPLSSSEVQRYFAPPPPNVNPFLDRWRSAEGKAELLTLQDKLNEHDKERKRLNSGGLVKYLIEARKEAMMVVADCFREWNKSGENVKEILYTTGAYPEVSASDGGTIWIDAHENGGSKNLSNAKRSLSLQEAVAYLQSQGAAIVSV